MSKPIKPVDIAKATTIPLESRPSLVSSETIAPPLSSSSSFKDFWNSLPPYLGVNQLKGLAGAVLEARKLDKPVIWGMGSHVIKVGLSQLIIELLEKKIITAIALNGSGIIHDAELSLAGKTSEDVAQGIKDGRFGMARETGELLNEAAKQAYAQGRGLGEMVGELLVRANPPLIKNSICAAARRLEVPLTVHVAIGTDIIHMHPSCDPAAIGAASHYDFRLLTGVVAEMGEGGIYLNVGSSVILPEIFMKAVNLARNLGHKVDNFKTANLDFLQSYRVRENVLTRPLQGDEARSFSLTGHHEIMIPLLAQALIEQEISF